MLPGIDAEMREFGQSGIKHHERELLAANAQEIETLLTMLKLRDDWEGREMAWHLQWLLLKAETRERRGHCSGFDRPSPDSRDRSAKSCSRRFAQDLNEHIRPLQIPAYHSYPRSSQYPPLPRPNPSSRSVNSMRITYLACL